MKKPIVIILLIALCVIGLLSLSACEEKGDLWIKDAQIEAVLSENGDLSVTETWLVKTTSDEGYRNLYRTLNTYDEKFSRSSELVFSGASDGNGKEYPKEDAITDMENDSAYEYNVTHYKNRSYVLSKGGAEYEIGVIIPAISDGDTKTVSFRYVMKGFAGAYADVAEFDWAPYSTDFSMYIEKLNVRVTMPAGVNYADEENTFAWLHCTAASNIALSGNVITVTASKIDAGTNVGIHSLVPTSCFSGLGKTSSDSKRTALISQEDEWQREYLKEQKKRIVLGIVDDVLAIFFVLFAIVFVVLSHVFGRYRVKDKVYLREIPKDWTPAEMGEFFYWYRGGARKHSGAILSATMLDLARREYLDILPDAKQDYLIEVKAVPQSMKDDLRDFETELMILLSEVQKSNGNMPFSMKFFEKYAKEHLTFVNKHMDKFIKCAQKKFKSGQYVEKKNTMQTIGAILGFLFILVGTVLAMRGKYFFYVALGGWVGGLSLILGTYKILPLNEKGNKIHADTLALRDYMLDFSNLKEYEIPQLVLWEEYLVYATMMGISEKVMKKLKLVYKELSDPGTFEMSYYRRGYIYTYFFLASRPRYVHGTAKPFDLGRSMQTAVRNANVISNAQQFVSGGGSGHGGFGGGGHGGGGFSGGGGFGGGGGGGRH